MRQMNISSSVSGGVTIGAGRDYYQESLGFNPTINLSTGNLTITAGRNLILSGDTMSSTGPIIEALGTDS